MNIFRSIQMAALLVSAALLAACSGRGNGGGNCGGYGSCNPVNPGAGVPTITLGAVPSIVSGTVTLTATPTAPNGVASVDFLVDNVPINPTPIAAPGPYQFTWDTLGTSDGAHGIAARVRDARGLIALASASVFVSNPTTFTIALNPQEEVPAVPSTATAATGVGTLTVNWTTGALSGSITLTNFRTPLGVPTTPTAAHIHQGFAGTNGPVIVNLTPDSANTVWSVPAGATLTPAQLAALRAGGLYVNAHSAQFPGGELRTQIKPPNVRVVLAELTGSQEVPAVATPGRGVVAVTVNSAANTASVHINSTNTATITAAHIHTGSAGQNGPVLINLAADGGNPNHWFVDDAAIPNPVVDLANFNGSRWYANVHTSSFAAGEIRGQVVAPLLLANNMSGSQEVPPANSSNNVRSFVLTFDPVTSEICTRGAPLPASDPTVASHIHSGPAGVNGPVIIDFGTNVANTCVRTTPALFAAVLNNPAGHYYNIHTTAFPGGAVRAQLTLGP